MRRVDSVSRQSRPGENYLLTARHDGLTDEIETLREFIEDLRLGIRSLDEYEAVCCPMRR
jgi:hypothetical protein